MARGSPRRRAQEFARQAPQYAAELDATVTAVDQALPWLGLRGQLGQLPEMLEPLGERLIALPLGIVSAVLGVLGVLFLSFYWLLERDQLVAQLARLAPRPHRARLLHVIERAEDKLGAYVRGQVVVSLIVGALTLIALTLLGVPHPFLLALVAAMLEVIPVLGPILASIPAIAVAAFQSVWLGLVVMVLYVVIQQLESHVLSPKVQQVAIKLSPFWILLAILLGGSLMGVLGALIAIPTAVLVSVLVEELTESLEEGKAR